MFLKFEFLIPLLCTFVCAQEKIIDYYEKLIKEELERSENYQFPKDASEYKPNNEYPEDYEEVDFVVIGGGSAGAVVASRLSEVKKWNILLLEAGKDENNFTEIPGMSRYVLHSEYNWGFNSTPQKHCCLETNGKCSFPRGRSLGGTSAINSLVYARGNKFDYDKWAEEGNPGWAYKDVLPYFIKSENSHIKGDDTYHGYNGTLNVNHHHPINPKINVFLEANKELEIPILDYNGENQLGASLTQFNIDGGRRDSSNRAFLKPAQNRKNLKVLTESYVTKILISNETDAAYGVIFSHKNIKYSVKVKKEIILSAGVIGSPQILMLSGIGPMEDLQKLGISVIKNLAVGENLHDHTTFYNTMFISSKGDPPSDLKEAIEEYYFNGTGILAITDDNEGLGFYQIRLNNSTAPDFEVLMIPSVNVVNIDKNNAEAHHGHYDSVREHHRSVRSLKDKISQFVIVLLHPKSRGKVSLNSTDPYEYPLIDEQCLADPENEDAEALYHGVQAAFGLLKTNAFKDLNPFVIPYPPCTRQNYTQFSKEYWMCNIRYTAMNSYHGSGTCKMGPDPSKGAVVDHRLRVHGIKNLRIADTSVIPVTLSAHMNAPAMMVGERLADFIKKENGVHGDCSLEQNDLSICINV